MRVNEFKEINVLDEIKKFLEIINYFCSCSRCVVVNV